MTRVRLYSSTLVSVHYQPGLIGRLFGRVETDRLALLTGDVWRYDVTGRRCEPHVRRRIESALRLSAVEQRLAVLTGDMH